jgi:hypothetical protein
MEQYPSRARKQAVARAQAGTRSLAVWGFPILMGTALMLLFATPAFPQATTSVVDTIMSGSPPQAVDGRLVITWDGFQSADLFEIGAGYKTVDFTAGALAIALVPNAGSTPSGTSYRVEYFLPGVHKFETWVVIASSPLADPAIPVSVTQQGAAGSTTYYYWCTATNATGETLLSPARITTTSHATLSGTNYNVILCATVTGANGYKGYRTTTSTAPSGTGLYLVGSSATTTINDQSNTLNSASIPLVNSTDRKTIQQVLVSEPPTPITTINPSQVTGGTASRCARFNASGALSSHAIDCDAGGKSIEVLIGCDSCQALIDTDDQLAFWRNNISAMTITEVWCQTDQGTSIINLQRNDGTPANILSSNLTCNTAGAMGAINLAEDNLALTNILDFVMVTAAATGTPKRLTVGIQATLD